jgi:predicted ABC-type transport system involved in lysophospholipase L1 biosynthesis ATPase subunit
LAPLDGGQASSTCAASPRSTRQPAGPFIALRGIDLTIKAGEFVAVVGKSGSGKSTLINMFTGIDHPTDGEVIVADTPIRHLDEGKMAEWRGRTMGIVFQFFQLLPTLSIVENVMIPMDLAGMYGMGERYDRAHAPAGAGGHGRRRAQVPGGALDRPGAARGHRPRPGQRPADPGRRRADRQPRHAPPRSSSSFSRRWWPPARRS